MDTPLFIFGVVLICVGIYQIGKRIAWFKRVLKYSDGSGGWSTLGGSICMVAGIGVILQSLQLQLVEALNSPSKAGTMNVPEFILGIIMICIGIWTVILQIKSSKRTVKDTYGYGTRLLIGGIGFIIIGIIAIVKSF